MKELIVSFNSKMKGNLDLIDQECQHLSFTVNTGKLVDYQGKETQTLCTQWTTLKTKFDKVTGPVVYWFQLGPDADPETIYKAARACESSQDRSSPSFRRLPAIKDECPVSTSTLYVGCCAKTSLTNRMFWHFGYYTTGRTQGLQLCHWTKPLNLDLAIHVLSFPNEAVDLIYVYEKLLAEQLKPLIGKH